MTADATATRHELRSDREPATAFSHLALIEAAARIIMAERLEEIGS